MIAVMTFVPPYCRDVFSFNQNIQKLSPRPGTVYLYGKHVPLDAESRLARTGKSRSGTKIYSYKYKVLLSILVNEKGIQASRTASHVNSPKLCKNSHEKCY